ncbi:hypothetical protein U1Q18_027830, partial [Sarracenia purpurea var. burkii]
CLSHPPSMSFPLSSSDDIWSVPGLVVTHCFPFRVYAQLPTSMFFLNYFIMPEDDHLIEKSDHCSSSETAHVSLENLVTLMSSQFEILD